MDQYHEKIYDLPILDPKHKYIPGWRCVQLNVRFVTINHLRVNGRCFMVELRLQFSLNLDNQWEGKIRGLVKD